MTDQANSTDPPIKKDSQLFDYILLAICLCVLACRATIPEGITSVLYAGKDFFASVVYNIILSAALIFSALTWFAVGLCRGRFRYRSSGIEFGLFVFIIAGFLSVYVASEKRLAVTDFVMFIGIFLMAVLLVQLLTSPERIRLVLYVITALGVMQAYECTDQFFASNELTIEQYEKDPNAMLHRVGVTPGSYRQMLLEHQLYSKDVRGYFTTGNSAGSFMLLALAAAIVLVLEKAATIKRNRDDVNILIIRALFVVFILFGLFLTHSKGAIAAGVAAVLIFIVHRLTADWLKRHMGFIFIASLVLFAAGVCLIIWYGSTHGRLPGGNSMLVRWQYWSGAAQIYADRPVTGVGGANFADFYPHYKTPAAPETVKDPHNFLLSLLSQYGPIGLLGFLATFLIPAGRILLDRKQPPSTEVLRAEYKTGKLAPLFLLVVAPVLLIVRALVLPSNLGNEISVMLSVLLFLFVIPIVIFSAAFLLLSKRQSGTVPGVTAKVVLFCSLIGVLLHNLVDFAIFEPGVLTAFWAVAACIIALESIHKEQQPRLVTVAIPARIAGLFLIGVSGLACLAWAVVPPIRSTAKVHRARAVLDTAARQYHAGTLSDPADVADAFDKAHSILKDATRLDTLSPKSCYVDAQIYIQQFRRLAFSRAEGKDVEKREMLLQAEKQMLTAIARNKADFKNYRTITEVYRLFAAISDSPENQSWLQKAYESASKAVETYPGSGTLRIECAVVTEQLGKTNAAVEQYERAVQIEDAYRAQFRQMYPGRKMFSRLGEPSYRWANKRIAELRDYDQTEPRP